MVKHIDVIVKKYFRIVFVIFLFTVAGCTANTLTPSSEAPTVEPNSISSQILFDDFSYTESSKMLANGWIIRSGQGWPGVPGATFRPENVSFMDYPNPAGNRLLRMTSSTDGTSENT